MHRSPAFSCLNWLALLALAAVGLLAACQSGGDGAAAQGPKIYAAHQCGICHGDDRAGKSLAPPLKGLSAHWTADQLVNDYFPDPVGFQNKDPRLSGMLKTYSTMKMPPVQGSPEDLKALAQWLVKN